MTEVGVVIDEVDVTGLAVEGSVTRSLNQPGKASVRLPYSYVGGDTGELLKIYLDGVLHHHGKILNDELTMDENSGYVVFQSVDPLELWKWRPVRDPDGDFSKPDILNVNVNGPAIVEAMFDASINAGAGPPADAEGPLFLQKGTIEYGDIDVTGAPTDWPMTMAQLATLLVGTGETDIVVTPIEVDIDGNYGRMDVFPGNYGFDLTTSVAFQYGMGAHNIRSFRRNKDMTNLVNKLWYYLGPKCDDQHWPANIVGTAGGVDNPDFWSSCGASSDAAEQWDAWHDNVVAAAGTGIGSPGDSRGDFGVRMDIRIWDAQGDNPDCTPITFGYCFYKKLWLEESWLRLQPQQMIHITPTRDNDSAPEIGSFDIGDLVLVECTPAVRGGFSGAERIYEYTVGWDGAESVPFLSELQTSPNNEGFD